MSRTAGGVSRPGTILGFMRATPGSSSESAIPSRLNPLGDFLRSRRNALIPEIGECKTLRRRRTPGLRREEVAERAGIGIDWYIRLEQGRTVMPSSVTIEALAKALRLNKVECAHLRALASKHQRSAFVRETVSEDLRRMLSHLTYPAYIIGQRWDLLAWNDAAEELFAGLTKVREQDRNLLLLMLTAPEMKSIFADVWEAEGKRMLALFRTTYDFWAGDAAFVELRERLRAGCPQFESWWNTHDVGSGAGVQKLLHHPTRGILRFSTASFQANDDPALKLAIYTPV